MIRKHSFAGVAAGMLVSALALAVSTHALAGTVTTDGTDIVIKTKGGLEVSTTDKEYSFKLGGRIQADYDTFDGFYTKDNNTADASYFRRAILELSGNYKDWNYVFNYDFGNGSSTNWDQATIAYTGFNFDPTLERWRATQPDYVSFVRVPAVWNPLLQLHARAFYTAEVLNKGAEMHSALFREIHENRNMLDTPAKLQEFFGRFGVDAATFTSTFESFAVQMKLQRADELNRRYRIQSVPTIIVNGKYTTDGGQAGSYDDLLALVDELVATERAGR